MLIVTLKTAKARRTLNQVVYKYPLQNKTPDELVKILTEFSQRLKQNNNVADYIPCVLDIDYAPDKAGFTMVEPLATIYTDENNKLWLTYVFNYVGRPPQFYLPDIPGVEVH